MECNEKSDCSVEEETEKVEKSLHFNDPHFEMLIYIKDSSLGKTKTVFYFIRNAFAHGSFSVFNNNGKPVYYLENKYKNKVKGRFRLKESTLLRWIELFNSSPSELNQVNVKTSREI